MKRIVAFGDSITYGNGSSDKSGYIIRLESKLDNVKVINRGLNAESTDWALQRIDRVIEEEEPDIMLIMEGINDIILHKDHNIVENLRKIIKICKQNNIKPYISTILPIKPRFSFLGRLMFSLSNIVNKKNPKWLKSNKYYDGVILEVNNAIKTMAIEEGIGFVDIFKHFKKFDLDLVLNDQIHPNDKGYEKIAELWSLILK